MGMNPMVESVKNHPKNKDNIINLNPGLLNPLVSRCLDQQTPRYLGDVGRLGQRFNRCQPQRLVAKSAPLHHPKHLQLHEASDL